MNNYVTSLIRTYVPLGVGLLATFIAAKLGVEVPKEHVATVAGLAVAGVSALYYAGARALEKKYPWAAKLLGSMKQPTYRVPPED